MVASSLPYSSVVSPTSLLSYRRELGRQVYFTCHLISGYTLGSIKDTGVAYVFNSANDFLGVRSEVRSRTGWGMDKRHHGWYFCVLQILTLLHRMFWHSRHYKIRQVEKVGFENGAPLNGKPVLLTKQRETRDNLLDPSMLHFPFCTKSMGSHLCWFRMKENKWSLPVCWEK